MTLIDLTGQSFGRLTVIERAATRITASGQRRTYWLCACECGNEIEANSQNLRNGKAGCPDCRTHRQPEDLAGQRFGRLLVIEMAPRNGRPEWLCSCSCGSSKVVLAQLLKRGDANSCGCLSREATSRRQWRGHRITYSGAHARLTRIRGKASDQRCIDCGGPAADWSYCGNSSSEQTEMVKGALLAYSANVNDYSPRCRSCHTNHDNATRTRTGATA